jgi:proline iminopeptidase
MPVARFPFGPERREKIEAVLGKEKIARRDEVARRIPTASDEDAIALCREQLSIGMSAYLMDQRHLAHIVDRCNDMSPASIRNRPNVARAGTASLGDWDFRPLLARLTMPKLVFEGARTNVPLSSTREWARVLPHARLLLIPDSGHEFWAEKPDEFVVAADRFLRGEYPEDSELVRSPRP